MLVLYLTSITLSLQLTCTTFGPKCVGGVEAQGAWRFQGGLDPRVLLMALPNSDNLKAKLPE